MDVARGESRLVDGTFEDTPRFDRAESARIAYSDSVISSNSKKTTVCNYYNPPKSIYISEPVILVIALYD